MAFKDFFKCLEVSKTIIEIFPFHEPFFLLLIMKIEKNEFEKIEVKSKDDDENVLLVLDRLGKYLRLTY